jgi:hypothetical protein
VLFAVRVLFGAGGDQHRVVRTGDLGDRRRDGGVERVADLLDDQSDGRRGSPRAQGLCDAVAPESQFGHGGEDPIDEILLYVWRIVDHP